MRSRKAYPMMLLACAPLAAPASATDLDYLNAWITKPPVAWKVCPIYKNVPQPPAFPAFAYNNAQLNMKPPLGACRQNGPFQWKTSHWWVQVISNLRPKGCLNDTCLKDLIRVCSLSYVRPQNSPPKPGGGPCQSTLGVGPAGCEVCAVPAP